MATRNRAIKYRLFPSEEQEQKILQTFGCVRKVYNDGLSLQNGLYEAGFQSMSKYDLNNFVNRAWKEEFPFLREVDKFAITNSVYALSSAFENFFQHRGKYPRFKSRKDRAQSYTTNRTNRNIEIIAPARKGNHRGWVKLPKLGHVPALLHRLPPQHWVLKSATVSVDCSGKYFVSVLFAYEQEVPFVPVPTAENTLGLDYSSPHFYVDSNGQDAGVPSFFRQAEKRLAKEQRKLSKMVRGSSNYKKQRLKVQNIHQKVSRQRLDFCHKRSREIANSYDAVCVEDIDLKVMSRTLTLGKATMDNGFGQFRLFLQYKLEEQGKYLVTVDKWYPSSKTCHECGCINKELTLNDRTWVCPQCGSFILRDHNAAMNIRDEGLRLLREDKLPA